MDKYMMHRTPVSFTRTNDIPFHKDSYSCPKEVRKSFDKLSNSCEYKWGDNVVHFFYETGDCDRKLEYITTLLSVLNPPKPLRADIILSSVKKTYPKGRIFGPSHVNTGYASDEKIVVYREEEWLKVFIHECFHFFHFETALMDPTLVPKILDLFPVNSPVNLYESFCELWARTLNCYMISTYTNIPVSILIRNEKQYSRRHMVNVLAHMGLTYEDIQKKNSGFKEHTNVLSYVVLTNILFNNNYLETHPYHIASHGEEYVEFIASHYKNPQFVKAIQHTKPHTTTTMSLYTMDAFE